mgnify:CR=1 FL=1
MSHTGVTPPAHRELWRVAGHPTPPRNICHKLSTLYAQLIVDKLSTGYQHVGGGLIGFSLLP